VGEIVDGLDGAARARIEELRKAGRFFWLDVSLGETSPGALAAALAIPEHALQTLTTFGQDDPLARRFTADGKHVAFSIDCYLELDQAGDDSQYRLQAVTVRVLITGDYLLSVHQERVSLPARLAPYMPEGRSEQYAVYAVLDAMIASAFDALNEVEDALDHLSLTSTDLRGGRLRMATLRETSSRLSLLRRQAAPKRSLFERIGLEITRIEGLGADEERYFEHIAVQLNRLVDAIDAAADSMATLIDLRLNETSYWLTVVATIFLPLTFITGFFGMNFEWMIGEVDTQPAFWLLGVGSLVVGVALIWRLVVRGSPVQAEGRSGTPLVAGPASSGRGARGMRSRDRRTRP
jgi:magnesium transporter